MSPRPRKVSDQDVHAAVIRAMHRLGPGDLTLAEIADEAGVTAAALIHRFGSRRELLLSLSRAHAESSEAFLLGLYEQTGSGVAALREYATCMADLAASPAALARNLSYLQVDLTDPDFRKHLGVQARKTRAGIETLIRHAIEAGELAPDVKPRVFARTIEAILAGSMMTWGFYREGTAADWIRTDLDAVLAPLLMNKQRRRT